MKKTILLLAAGTNACFHTAKILARNFGDSFRILGADINKPFLISSVNYLEKAFQVPPYVDKEYYGTILRISREEGANYLLPIFDADQSLFFNGNRDLREFGCTSLGIPEAALKIYANKRITNDFLRENGLPVPKTFSAKSLSPNEEYFVKPIDGRGSIGARKTRGNDIPKSSENLLIQEICTPPEFTTECFYLNGRMSSVTRERIATKSGVCTKARIFHDAQFHGIAKKFAECVPVPMCFNLQFMKNGNGEFVITDVNLRLAGGMGLSFAAGWDVVSAMAKKLLGESEEEIFSDVPAISGEKYVVRAYEEILTAVIP